MQHDICMAVLPWGNDTMSTLSAALRCGKSERRILTWLRRTRTQDKAVQPTATGVPGMLSCFKFCNRLTLSHRVQLTFADNTANFPVIVCAKFD